MIVPVEVSGMIIHAEEIEVGMISQIFKGQEYGAVPWESLDSPTIIDIGANIGAFACYAHSKSSSSRIHCFEPNPKSVELLVMNAPFATIHPVALGGMAMFALGRVNKSSALEGAGIAGLALGGVSVAVSLPLLLIGSTSVKDAKGSLIAISEPSGAAL